MTARPWAPAQLRARGGVGVTPPGCCATRCGLAEREYASIAAEGQEPGDEVGPTSGPQWMGGLVAALLLPASGRDRTPGDGRPSPGPSAPSSTRSTGPTNRRARRGSPGRQHGPTIADAPGPRSASRLRAVRGACSWRVHRWFTRRARWRDAVRAAVPRTSGRRPPNSRRWRAGPPPGTPRRSRPVGAGRSRGRPCGGRPGSLRAARARGWW